jgi:CheY-like chemotaxis protein
MNGVIGMTGLLLDTDLNDEQRCYAETVRRSGESLLFLLNDILDFSKIEAGKLEVETIDFDLPSLLEDFSAVLAVRAEEKGLKFICAAAPEVPTYLSGDPGRLRQILTNLAGNAVKFTEQGEIVVRATLLSETDTKAVVRFSVKDSGIGIPAEKHSLIFQKFTQADSLTTREYGGTGLGLAISKELAELMGGEIGLLTPPTSLREGEEGKGSEFWFTLPLEKQPERNNSDAPYPITRHTPRETLNLFAGRKARILLAKDNITNQLVALGILRKFGLSADAVANGLEALKAVKDPLRPGPDGSADAGDGRDRGYPPDPRSGVGGGQSPNSRHCDDRPRHVGGSGAVPGGGDERLRHQTGRSRGAGEGAGEVANEGEVGRSGTAPGRA